jgi:hypothetical protein
VQLLASVTVTVLTPEVCPLITEVVCAPDQRYVYGDVPPEAVTVAAPVEAPKHNTLVTAVEVANAEAGCVVVATAVTVQPLLSVIVQVRVAAFKVVITELV